MDEPVGIVLDFLRLHNFEKAEEALRLELLARHSLVTSTDRHIKVDTASPEKDGTILKDCQRKVLLPQITPIKSESESSLKRGIVDKQMHGYAEWEFKSCSNSDCVLEFKRQHPPFTRLSEEASKDNNHTSKENGAKSQDHIHKLIVKGSIAEHLQKPETRLSDFTGGTSMGLASSQKEQHTIESRGDHLSILKASGELHQDRDMCEGKNWSQEKEPRLVLETSSNEVKALSPHFFVQNLASCTCSSFSDRNLLKCDEGKRSKSKEPSLQLLPAIEDFGQLEEKQVVHDCIDYIKALTLEDQTKPPWISNDKSIPWLIDMQSHYFDGESLSENQTQESYNVNSSCLRTSSSSFNNVTGIGDNFELDKLHTNALFEPTFNLGSFLDIPVGQELASPDKQENDLFHQCYTQNDMQDTPELLSGFATLGDEPTDPGVGYTQDYWDSDMYEDNEDPGYEKQEVEDEDWFLAHEIFYPSDKSGTFEEKMVEDLLSQGNQGNERQVEENLSLCLKEALDTGYSDFSLTKSSCDISCISTRVGQSTTSGAPLTSHVGSLSYDGHLMDAEELKFMREESIWQGLTSQFEEHVHHNRNNRSDADERHFYDNTSEKEPSSDSQSKKTVEHLNFSRDFSDKFGDPTHREVCRDNHKSCGAESNGSINTSTNRPELNLIHEAVKEASGCLTFKNAVDGFCYSGPLDLLAFDPHGPITKGCLRDSYTSNQGLTFQCPPCSVKAVLSDKEIFFDEKDTEDVKSEGIAVLHQDEQLAVTGIPENRQSSNVAFLSYSKGLYRVPFPEELHKARDETMTLTSYECAADEVAVDDEDISSVQEEAQMLKMEEDEHEIFSLRIVHRKNRTGFEEDKHFQVVLNSVVAGRYLITEYLGSAAFSKAVQARDLQTGMDVCLKIIKNNKDFFDQSLDEIKLLKYVNKNDPADKNHLLRLYDYFYHREHLFIVCELLRANLYEFHKFNNDSGGEPYFTMSRLQSITRQCLEALEFLHGLGLIHCDLKPENILIKSYSRCEIKVIDLGSSCFQTDHLCSYVQSRSYRAPEVILGLPYSEKIDVWSLGCILAELCSGTVLFQNDSLATLLARVIGIIEPISGDMILKGKESHKYFTKNSMLYERNQDTNKLEYVIPKKSSLRHRLQSGDQGFVDFVGYLLQVNPENRPSASEALKHPWLTHPYEPVCL